MSKRIETEDFLSPFLLLINRFFFLFIFCSDLFPFLDFLFEWICVKCFFFFSILLANKVVYMPKWRSKFKKGRTFKNVVVPL